MVRSGTPKRPTSADVALAAGLSRSTVSYVLNNDPNQKIPESTRQRVLDAAAKLGYSPSAAARALRSGRSDLILCLLPDWPMGSALGALLEHLSASLEAHDLTLVLHPRVHSKRPTSELWRSISPAAVIVFESLTPEEDASIRAAGAAVVSVFVTNGKAKRGQHGPGEEHLGRRQVEHLIDTGHTHLGYAYPDDDRLRAFADPRLAGVQQACAANGVAPPDVRLVPLDPIEAQKAVRGWRSARPRITAICAYNDEVAMAVLAAAGRLKLRVPADLAVVGVDDIPAAPLTQPPLTTVTRNLAAYAESVATLVVRALEGQPPPRRSSAANSVTLIRRDSA